MTELEIVVRGHSRGRYAPERGVVDLEELSEFIDTWSGEEGVTVAGVRRDVHEASRRAHERELRREAVEDAIAKAQAYSDAVGRGPVTPTLLSDPDMGASDAEVSRRRRCGAWVSGRRC